MKLRLFSAALVAGASLAAAPAAFAQTPGGVMIAGVAVANQQVVVGTSNAYKGAAAQLQITYKPQLDQAKARAAALRAQIKPLFDKFNADRKVPNPVVATLQTEYGQIQQIQQSGQQEIEQILAPMQQGRAYAIEQIADKLDAATQGAMTKRRVTLVLDSQTVFKADPAYHSIDQDIVDQLNTLVPSVSVTPPAGWLPRQQREQQAQEQAAAAAEAAADGAAAPAAPKKQPQGR